jgi:hypothetical protein
MSLLSRRPRCDDRYPPFAGVAVPFHSLLRPSRAALVIALVTSQVALANPLSRIGETFSDWKHRLFDRGSDTPAVVDAPAEGAIALQPGQPLRFTIGSAAPERDFAKGRSRYRIIELPEELAHAAVRIQVVAQPNQKGRGNTVFKPLLYRLDGDEQVGDPVEAKPLHLDMRPFKRTRLLACVPLDKVRRFAVATTADVVGKSYESEAREALKAPTNKNGFYYSTDAVKVKLPYAATGRLIVEVSAEDAPGQGC